MRFRALPVTSLEDATLDFEQLQSHGIFDTTPAFTQLLAHAILDTTSAGGALSGTYPNPALVPVTSAAWIVPTLLNSWTNGGGAAYLKDPLGFVHFRGSLFTAGTTTGTAAFILPVGYRPGISDFFPALQSGGAAGGFVRVDVNGTVQPTYAAQPQVWLNVVTFLAEN